ncbi:MAG: WGR domain-containing protein [Anaerolineae bacterium]|nr:WGR domain-containing protein [Gloeobacterales cyanobacterium ES-bin-313]
MKLIQRTSLYYQEGTSDKVYEVDLCEVSDGRFVVNYRYGKRGGNLKEGVETPQALSQSEAQRAFDKLVASKVKKGYRESSTAAPERTATSKPPRRGANPELRRARILQRLDETSNVVGQLFSFVQNVLGSQPLIKTWPLERVIWRAGELGLREATPLLIKLIGSSNSLRDYCIAWALGHCGDKNAIVPLNNLCSGPTTEAVRRIGFEAMRALASDALRAQLIDQAIDLLPPNLRESTRHDPPEIFDSALKIYLESESVDRFSVLIRLYYIDNPQIRPTLLKILKTLPFAFGTFQPIRHIFKMAEYRHDGEVFSLLARRFEQEKANYRSPKGQYSFIYLQGEGDYNYLRVPEFKKYLQERNTQFAYSTKTRDYLRKRVWRTLRRLGQLESSEYLTLATGILLTYSDDDAQEPREAKYSRYDYRQRRTITLRTIHWDRFAPYLIFNHILYTNSPRYELKHNTKAWRCKAGFKPGGLEPIVREEAFPKLWEQYPEHLLVLLEHSHCLLVHHFAIKVLQDCTDFCAGLEIPQIVVLLGTDYAITTQFGFELAQAKYDANQPDLPLVLAVANCIMPDARAVAQRWITENQQAFLGDTAFLAALITSRHLDTQAFAQRLLTTANLSESQSLALVGRLLAGLIALTEATPGTAGLVEILATLFAQQLRNINLEVVLDLLRHPLAEVQTLGARILLNHATPVTDLPVGLIAALINSPYPSVRAVGIRLFGQLPESQLLEEQELLVVLASHELRDLRSAIRPVIRRLGANNPAFASHLAAELIPLLLRREVHEGVHRDLTLILREDIPGWMVTASCDLAMNLLRAKATAAQELGGLVLQRHSENWAADFNTAELVQLANHEILAVREASWSMFLQVLPERRLHPEELTVAARYLDGKWEDTRQFGEQVFLTHLIEIDFTPALLVNICDSVNEKVRSFGRELILRYFKVEQGQQYLSQLSEHPSADLQLFATGYLEDYAQDSPERLRELTPYFLRILSGVNRGRIAKARIFAFLHREALKSEAAAHCVAAILTRQSLTIAIGNKAAAIEAMIAIRQIYPDISLPIQPIAPAHRI